GQGGTGDELFNLPVRAVGRSVVIVGMVMLCTVMMAVMPVVSGISVAPSGLVVRVLVAVMIVLVVTLLRMARLIRCLALDRDEELLRADPPSPRLDQLEAPILGKLKGTEPFLHIRQGHAQIQKGRQKHITGDAGGAVEKKEPQNLSPQSVSSQSLVQRFLLRRGGTSRPTKGESIQRGRRAGWWRLLQTELGDEGVDVMRSGWHFGEGIGAGEQLVELFERKLGGMDEIKLLPEKRDGDRRPRLWPGRVGRDDGLAGKVLQVIDVDPGTPVFDQALVGGDVGQGARDNAADEACEPAGHGIGVFGL